MTKWMMIFSEVVVAVLVVFSLPVTNPALAKQPNPIEFEPMATRISDGNGGKNTLYMVILVQPKRASDVSNILAHTKEIKNALIRRLRTVNSKQLIPPEGNTEWLEEELWTLAEQILKPLKLDGAFFRELSIQ